MASAVQRPCLSAFVLPVGAPLPTAPPCILHLRFPRTAGDWHKLPLRVRAPHRGARFMGDFSDCIGWFPGLLITPAPGGDGTDDRLGTGMDMDVLDGDALLTLAAVTVEGFGQSRVGSRELGRLFQVLMPTVEILHPKHRTPVTLHGGVMARDSDVQAFKGHPCGRFRPAIGSGLSRISRLAQRNG